GQLWRFGHVVVLVVCFSARAQLTRTRGRDAALRRPRPRSAGGHSGATNSRWGPRCAAGRGADGSASRPLPAQGSGRTHPTIAEGLTGKTGEGKTEGPGA